MYDRLAISTGLRAAEGASQRLNALRLVAIERLGFMRRGSAAVPGLGRVRMTLGISRETPRHRAEPLDWLDIYAPAQDDPGARIQMHNYLRALAQSLYNSAPYPFATVGTYPLGPLPDAVLAQVPGPLGPRFYLTDDGDGLQAVTV